MAPPTFPIKATSSDGAWSIEAAPPRQGPGLHIRIAYFGAYRGEGDWDEVRGIYRAHLGAQSKVRPLVFPSLEFDRAIRKALGLAVDQ